jgi:hypothetical protein
VRSATEWPSPTPSRSPYRASIFFLSDPSA